MENIKVTIIVLAYNHAPYLRQCLEGIIMQKTNFAFEAIIHDDNSTDDSKLIIEEYREKYPLIIKPIYESENLYSQNISIMSVINKKIRGKYIAFCEGDDYWTNCHKLQKQTDILERNKDSEFCHTNIQICNHNHLEKPKDSIINLSHQNYPISERLLNGTYVIRTATALFSSKLYFEILSENDFTLNSGYFLMGDIPLWFEFAKRTKIIFLNIETAVYRINFGSAAHQIDLKRKLRFSLSMFELREYLSRRNLFSDETNNFIHENYKKAVINYFIIDPNFTPLYPIEDTKRIKFIYFRKQYLRLRWKILPQIKANMKNLYNSLLHGK